MTFPCKKKTGEETQSFFERSLFLEENTHSAAVRSVVVLLESVTDKNNCTIYQHQAEFSQMENTEIAKFKNQSISNNFVCSDLCL